MPLPFLSTKPGHGRSPNWDCSATFLLSLRISVALVISPSLSVAVQSGNPSLRHGLRVTKCCKTRRGKDWFNKPKEHKTNFQVAGMGLTSTLGGPSTFHMGAHRLPDPSAERSRTSWTAGLMHALGYGSHVPRRRVLSQNEFFLSLQT